MIEYEGIYARLKAIYADPAIKPYLEPSAKDWDDPILPPEPVVSVTPTAPPLLTNYPVRFVAIGTPGPQGSKVSKGPGVMVESSKKVKPWRERVAWTFRELYPRFVPLDGPLVARMIFTLTRPATVPANRVDAADRYPDVSKLARSTEDALTKLAWADDARIIGYDRQWKTYPGRDAEALNMSGAVIAVRRATHAEIGLEPDSKAGLRYTELIEKWGQSPQHCGPNGHVSPHRSCILR